MIYDHVSINYGAKREDAEERARDLLGKVGLTDEEISEQLVWELSGGQQQRLAIAAVLAIDPEVIIFDNVLDKLDPRGQKQVCDIIESLSGEKTLIIVEQDIDLLLRLTGRLLILEEGQIVAEGSTAKILREQSVLKRADLNAPTALRIAHGLGLKDAPLNEDEFADAVRHVSTSNGKKSPPAREFGEQLVKLLRSVCHTGCSM